MTRLHILAAPRLNAEAAESHKKHILSKFPEIRHKKLTEIHLDLSQCEFIDKEGVAFLRYLCENAGMVSTDGMSKKVKAMVIKHKVDTYQSFRS